MDHEGPIMLVKFRSALPFEEVLEVARERLPEFQAIGGLTQKFYLQDAQTGEVAGLYFWRSPEDLEAYKTSELRKTIPESYKIVGEPRIEVFKVFETLR